MALIPIFPESGLPTSGSAGQVLVKTTDGSAWQTLEYDGYWAGKRAMFFGTSITWYCMSGKTNETNGYPQLVAEQLNLDFSTSRDVIGTTGAAIADSSNTSTYGSIFRTIISNDTFSSADLVCIEGCTNDFKLDVPIGVMKPAGYGDYNISTFIGALQYSIDHILNCNNELHILLIADTQRDNDGYDAEYKNNSGHYMKDYVNAMIAIGNLYGIPVCDWYHKSGINTKNLSVYTNDGLHLNAAGYARVAPITAEAILSMGSDSPVYSGVPFNGTEGQVLMFTEEGAEWVDQIDISGKQDKLSGTSGQLVAFNDAGEAAARNMITPTEIGAQNEDYLIVVTSSSDVYSMNRTYDDILYAYDSGHTILVDDQTLGIRAPYVYMGGEEIDEEYVEYVMFSTQFNSGELTVYTYKIYTDNTIEFTSEKVSGSADGVTYDNTTSGLTATNVQDAIDEMKSVSQSKITGTAGDFVVIGSDGNVTTKTIEYAEEVDF